MRGRPEGTVYESDSGADGAGDGNGDGEVGHADVDDGNGLRGRRR